MKKLIVVSLILMLSSLVSAQLHDSDEQQRFIKSGNMVTIVVAAEGEYTVPTGNVLFVKKMCLSFADNDSITIKDDSGTKILTKGFTSCAYDFNPHGLPLPSGYKLVNQYDNQMLVVGVMLPE